MRGRIAVAAVGLTWIGLRLVACGYDYDALKGAAAGQGGYGPGSGSGGIAVLAGTGGAVESGRGGAMASGAGGTGLGEAGAAGQPGPGGGGGEAGSMPVPPGSGGGGVSTGGQVSIGGASGAAGARATGGTSGAAGTASGGNSGALQPVYASYSFDQTAGPAITDASGNGHDGALEGTATFGTGVIRNDLKLDGAAGTYVRLPAGLVATLRDTTIAFWVRPRANASSSTAWERVFDFGVNTTSYMFFTSSSTSYSGDTAARFGITVAGNYNEQRLDATGPLPGESWTHVAIVLGSSGGVLYLNGAANATNAGLNVRPADLGTTGNDWLGRSQFAGDPNFAGEIDELRIYAASLTPEQVAALYRQR